MTPQRKLLAALIGLAAACLAALLWWSRLDGDRDGGEKPAAKPAAPAPEQPRRMGGGDTSPGTPPAAPQVTADDDPVGPLLLEGQVVDSSDQPVGGATVRLSSNPPRTATSDRDGSFSFDKLVPRTYELTARRGADVGGPVQHTLRAHSDPLVIRLAAGATALVTVVAAGAGAAIAGATVELEGDESLGATTDSTGVARLAGVRGGRFATVSARASGHAPGQALLQVPDSPRAVVKARIELRRGAPVSGTVMDESDQPIADARVSARDVSQLFQLSGEKDQATTDARGRFTLPAVAAGTYRFHATHPEHAPGSAEPRAVDGTRPVEGVRIVLGRGARLAGRVVDRGGEPAAWATVRVGPRREGGFTLGDFATRQVVAGERGEFELKGLPRAKLVALAMSEEASSAAVDVDLAGAAERRDLILTLDVSGRIEGIVVDSAGQPVAEAHVTAYPDFFAGELGNDFAMRGPAVEATDGGGHFAFRGLPDRTYRLHASRSGTTANPLERKWTKAATGDTGVRLVLDRDGGIRGRVQFADGSAPAMFTISVGFSPGLPVASADGAFELPGVEPGKYDLTVRGPDFSQAVVRDVVVAAAEVRDVGVIKVERGRQVSGRVLAASGGPVAGATVVLGEQILSDGKALSSSLARSFGEQMGLRNATSDEEGRYTIAGIGTAKDLVIAAEHETEGRSLPVTVPAGAKSQQIDLRLAGVGSLAGLVKVGGVPAGQVAVVATSPAASSQNTLVTTGDDGRYQIERLASGRYRVTATRGMGMKMTMAARSVQIDAGARAELDIDIPLGDIALAVTVKPKGAGTVDMAQIFLFSGRVSVANGKQIRDAMASASEAGGVKMAFAQGASPATFTEVAPGLYSVCILPITGDVSDGQFLGRLQAQSEKLKVYCDPHTVPATPKQQSITAAVPPMEPLE